MQTLQMIVFAMKNGLTPDYGGSDRLSRILFCYFFKGMLSMRV